MTDGNCNQLITCAGSSLKLWSPPNYELSRELVPPHPHAVGNIVYDHINGRLFSSNVVGQGILQTTLSDDKSILLTPDISACVLDLSHNCKYIVGGSIDGRTTLLDVKNSKIKQTYHEHRHRVTAIKLSSKSISSGASGDESGTLVSYNVASGRSSKLTQAAAPEEYAVSCLDFSRFKHAFLSSGHSNGSVKLWDTTSSKQLSFFDDIFGDEVSCLSFSPINEMLLLTASRDSTIAYLDVNSKTLVKKLPTESAVTQCVLMQDGHTSAVANDQGLVLLYDLRKFGPPFCYFTAHLNSSITHLSQLGAPSLGRSTNSRPSSMIDQGFTTSSTDSDVVDWNEATPAFSYSQNLPHHLQKPIFSGSVFSPMDPPTTVRTTGLSAMPSSPVKRDPKARILSSPDENSVTTVSGSLNSQNPKFAHAACQTEVSNPPEYHYANGGSDAQNTLTNGIGSSKADNSQAMNSSGVDILRKTVLEGFDKLEEKLHRDIVSVNMNTYKDFFQMKTMMSQLSQQNAGLKQELEDLKNSISHMQEKSNFFS